jgi:hypothetical protein
MDTRSGRLYDLDKPDNEDFRKLAKALGDLETARHMVPVAKVHPAQAKAGKIGRNALCPCGSGKKFKACCMGRAASSAERRELAEAIRAKAEELDAKEVTAGLDPLDFTGETEA